MDARFHQGDYVSYFDGRHALAGTCGRIAEVQADGALVYWNSGASGFLPLRRLAHREPTTRERRTEARRA